MTPEQAAALRAPFPPEAIGKLPRVTCKACREVTSKCCDKHKKHQCAECGNWITEKHIHLDYVGHAAVTDRLLEVDPEWTWTPAAADPTTNAPVCTDGGLWIVMTVCGVNRWGWGDGPDIKQRISDAIRNAAMRFGVALDLWSKEDLHASNEVEAGSSRAAHGDTAALPGPSPTGAAPPKDTPGDAASTPSQKNRRQALKARCVALTADGISVADAREAAGLPIVDSCDEAELAMFESIVRTLETQLAAPFVKADA